MSGYPLPPDSRVLKWWVVLDEAVSGFYRDIWIAIRLTNGHGTFAQIVFWLIVPSCFSLLYLTASSVFLCALCISITSTVPDAL